MKFVWNSIGTFTLLAYYCFWAEAASREQLASVFLRLFTSSDTYIEAHLLEAESLVHQIDNNKATVLYIHGFTESINSTSVRTIINAYLNRTDHNVLILDWSAIAGENYLEVAFNVESVGIMVAMALNDMVHAGLSPQKLHVVGHSMGAQVSGYVGRNTNFFLPRITGLDPAGPLFNVIGQHLRSSDAQFVDIIHTDYSFYGTARISGSVDFFPNGGRRIQPGCPTSYQIYSTKDFCSHQRSWTFYSESLLTENAFEAVPCSTDNRNATSKDGVPRTVLMGYKTPKNAKGTYCLFTRDAPPYGLGPQGAYATLDKFQRSIV